MTQAKNTICLWYDRDAEEAANFYAATFPDSSVTAVHKAPGDYPSGKEGDVLTVDFTVMGIPCIGLNGGPMFKHNEAFSFQVATEDQAETDRYWNAIVGNGGEESQCGWCKDRWGVSWQITPKVLTEAFAAGAVGAAATVNAPTFYAQLNQPSWAPPASVFGPVWSTLFVLMGIAAWLVWRSPGSRRMALGLFGVQLVFNALWSWLFFAW